MKNAELFYLLEMPGEVAERLQEYEKSKTDSLEMRITDLIADINSMKGLEGAIKEFVGEDPDGIKMLWEELNIASGIFGEYQRKGIPAKIFLDTMKFCTRFLNEYYKTYGSYRFIWGWWFPRQLSMREFRIGALEYEYFEEKCISVHIPSDADLSKPSVMKSLAEFGEFCKKYYPEWSGMELCCESWLLSPALNKVLGEDSNILQFQSLFEVKETDEESMAVLDWVFPGFDHVSEQLPERTSLQRNLKKYLLSGGKTGWSKGVLRREIFEL
ncbi:MAG: acyltransferase domain-containing protein [Lachnospiraceae bacterium]|nr:acyltransferase domain-containing protein [Lachnospiraceae bacterium]